MTAEEKRKLEMLDRILQSDSVREQIEPVITRVCADLKQRTEAVMAWEPIPLAIYGRALPPEIRSSWIFVLRAGADTGAERHPNSHQRMMSLRGSGDMRTARSGSRVESLNRYNVKSEEERHWRSNLLISDPTAPLEQRWVSIPPLVWHRPVIGKDSDWVVVSFHTVPAEELIEERPGADASDATRQMHYIKSRTT